MRYGYLCQEHGAIDSLTRADFIFCPMCSEDGIDREARRDWHFIIDSSFEPYWAPSFGQVITSRTHAKDLAKIRSEEQTLRTGIPHNYEVIDTHDDEAAGVNTEHKKAIQEETRRHAVNGAAWSQERFAEIQKVKDEKRAERVGSDLSDD